ncbi:MAG TPA: hypothetical protein VH353_10065 [Caulobacteraceae bacterium]|nr:hypothetical protein [Caulobacteraceae bacterium]
MANGPGGDYRYAPTMSDRLFFPLVALIALALIALSLVWPQGSGAPSPAPFGHPLAPMRQDSPAPPGAHPAQPAADGQG